MYTDFAKEFPSFMNALTNTSQYFAAGRHIEKNREKAKKSVSEGDWPRQRNDKKKV